MTDSWKHEPPYLLTRDDDNFGVKYTASCMCGTVQYAASSDPVSAKCCHCTDCQHLHGAPFQWAALFKKESLRFVKGVDSLMFYNSDKSTEQHELPCKVSCAKCHSPLADEGNNMWMSFPTAFKFKDGKVPDAFKPSCHIFYGSRCMDIKDGKDKWAGLRGKSDQLAEA